MSIKNLNRSCKLSLRTWFLQIWEKHHSINYRFVRPGGSGWSDTRRHGCALSPQFAGPGAGARRHRFNRRDSPACTYRPGTRLKYAVQRRGVPFPVDPDRRHRPADNTQQ